ncbi:DegT/DnrJ/EryC1/StrS family aminotransferase [Vibrio gigantis]
MIPFLDLKKINELHAKELKQACSRVIDSGWYLMGKELENFENDFSHYCGTKYCVGLANGLDALTITIRAWKELGKLKDGDEVIVQSNTFIASVLAITENNLIPVLVEPDQFTYNLTPSSIQAAITEKTRLILPVHLYGKISPMPEIIRIANEYNILVLEDCAQSHGANIDGKKSGSWGNAGAFSFYPGKNLGALGDAGAIITNDLELAKTVKAIGQYGSFKRYEHAYRGVNSRMDEIQAAMLCVKLKSLDEDIKIRREVANRYLTEIDNHLIGLPHLDDQNRHVWHLFVVRVCEREHFIEYMNKSGVDTLVHYPTTISKQICYEGEIFKGTTTDGSLHNEIVSIPISQVMSREDVSFIIETINSYSK